MNNYEIIHYEQGLSARILMHSVNHFHVHWHKEIELLLVLKGQIETSINGQKYTLVQDDLFLINSGELHSTAGNGDNILAAIQIDADFCKKTCPDLQSMRFDFKNCILKDSASDLARQLRMLVARIIYEYDKASAGYQLVIEGQLNILAALLVRNIPQTQEVHAGKATKEIGRIEAIMNYLDTHFTDKISLEDLAQSAFLSTSYLSHFFKDKVGLTFQEYITRIRLLEAVRQLESTDELIGNIAVNCGFASVKAFNKAFRSYYDATPGEYRARQLPQMLSASDSIGYMEFDSLQAMEKLEEYLCEAPKPTANPGGTLDFDADFSGSVGDAHSSLTPWLDSTLRTGKSVSEQSVRIAAHTDAPAPETWRASWSRIGAVGRAFDLLRADLQAHTRLAKEELGFSLLRFHGIFSDEMRVVRRDANGSLQFCWLYTDAVLDFLLSAGLAPVLDLTFMPSAIASGQETLFHYKGNITPPADMDEWRALLDSFVRHCINRYGAQQMQTWYFEIWNEPDYLGWPSGAAQYYNFFAASAQAIRAVDMRLRIAGPSIMHQMDNTGSWLPAFIEYVNAGEQRLDCFTFHVYGERSASLTASSKILAQLGGRQHAENQLRTYRQALAAMTQVPDEIFITEYNISAVHKNYLLDTMFPACALLENAIATDALLDGAAVWTLSDVFEEDAELLPAFSGGFGMMTAQGIRKPTWHALRFLHMLGNEVLQKGEGYIVTRTCGGEEIQILAYCYAHYDHMFANGDRSLLAYHRRYDVFEEGCALRLALTLDGLCGTWQIERQMLDRVHGSAYDLYEAMGAPEILSTAQAKYLACAAQPAMSTECAEADGRLMLTLEIPTMGIQFVRLTRQL